MEIKESENNHIVSVGSLFARQSQQNVIRENGVYVTPQFTPPVAESKDTEQK